MILVINPKKSWPDPFSPRNKVHTAGDAIDVDNGVGNELIESGVARKEGEPLPEVKKVVKKVTKKKVSKKGAK